MSQLKVIKDGTELLVSFNFSLKTPKWKRSSCDEVWETSAEIPYRWRVTTHIWVVFLIGLSKFLPHTTNQKELFLGRYFAGKPLTASRNVGCFLRLKLCSHLIKLKAIRGFFCWLASPTITPAKEKTRRNRVETREEREAKKNERFVFLHFTLATLKEKTWRINSIQF